MCILGSQRDGVREHAMHASAPVRAGVDIRLGRGHAMIVVTTYKREFYEPCGE